VVIRVRDHRGWGVDGLNFNVTLLDVDNNIVDSVITASRLVPITQDWGMETK
jgi:hypothetical protein